jgi:hypothetical protein
MGVAEEQLACQGVAHTHSADRLPRLRETTGASPRQSLRRQLAGAAGTTVEDRELLLLSAVRDASAAGGLPVFYWDRDRWRDLTHGEVKL